MDDPTEDNFRKFLKEFRIRDELRQLIQSSDIAKGIHSRVEQFFAGYSKGANRDLILAPIIVPFEIRCSQIRSEVLWNFLLEEPIRFTTTAKEIVYNEVNKILQAISETTLVIDCKQLHLLFRVLTFPVDERLNFDPSTNSLRKGLSVLHCILAGFTIHEKYIIQSTWLCSRQCVLSVLASEQFKPLYCSSCGADMKEYTKNRYMSDKSLLKVYPVQSLQTPRNLGKIYRSITVLVTDDLCDINFDLGQEYRIAGVYDFRNRFFKAWSLDKC